MLSVLQFYAGVSPNLVHRDPRGEWTGFPLMNQPAMAARLHPEEPMEVEAAWHWLNGRIPNGDARVVCCQLASEGSKYLRGLTFIGRLSFTPFVESMAQVNCDVDAGFPYLVGDVSRFRPAFPLWRSVVASLECSRSSSCATQTVNVTEGRHPRCLPAADPGATTGSRPPGSGCVPRTVPRSGWRRRRCRA